MKTKTLLAILVLAFCLCKTMFADLPTGWYESSTPGSVSYDEANESWTISSADFAAHYVYMCLKGDGQIIACVSEVYGCAGVGISDMISSSKYAQIYVGQTKAWFVDSITANPGHIVRGGPSYPNIEIEGPPYWVLLERTEDMFTGYVSPNGLPPWTKVGSQQILMSTDTWVQLRVTPGFGGLMVSSNSAKFSKVSVIGDTECPNNGWVVAEPNMYSTVLGNVGIGTSNPQGKLDVDGSIYQRGSELHADYVFEPGYKLESIDEHSRFMWTNRHLKAIPKASLDAAGKEVIEVGTHRKGIVEELEKAHIYIEQLNERIKTLEGRLARLEQLDAEQ